MVDDIGQGDTLNTTGERPADYERVPRHFGAYRIGGGPNSSHKHWAHRWHVDFWFRSWQCEWDEAIWCPRSWTKTMAERKGMRWFHRMTDIHKHEAKYGRNDVARAERITALAGGSMPKERT